METIRCLVCQGQSIADSDAEMAGDMRALVRERIAAGETPGQIRAWLISRYGDWVTYEPTVRALTWPLWAAPVAAARSPACGSPAAASGGERSSDGLGDHDRPGAGRGARARRFLRRDCGALQFLAAALLLALAGYSWQGAAGPRGRSQAAAGAPAAPRQRLRQGRAGTFSAASTAPTTG